MARGQNIQKGLLNLLKERVHQTPGGGAVNHPLGVGGVLGHEIGLPQRTKREKRRFVQSKTRSNKHAGREPRQSFRSGFVSHPCTANDSPEQEEEKGIVHKKNNGLTVSNERSFGNDKAAIMGGRCHGAVHLRKKGNGKTRPGKTCQLIRQVGNNQVPSLEGWLARHHEAYLRGKKKWGNGQFTAQWWTQTKYSKQGNRMGHGGGSWWIKR